MYFTAQSKYLTAPELVGGSQSPCVAQLAGICVFYAKAGRENQVSDP